jgi:hypothetical protein
MPRHRQSLLEQRNEVQNQIRALLATANRKLSRVATDLMRESGRAILRALAGGLRLRLLTGIRSRRSLPSRRA